MGGPAGIMSRPTAGCSKNLPKGNGAADTSTSDEKKIRKAPGLLAFTTAWLSATEAVNEGRNDFRAVYAPLLVLLQKFFHLLL